MTRASLIACLTVLLAIQVNSASITWTGAAGNGLWNFANNWSPAAIPTASDDVTINAVGGSTVTIGQPAAAGAIVIGGGSFGQSLVVLSRLSVGAGGIRVASGATLNVQNNDNLPLTSVGTVNFASGSQFIFQSGSIYGPGDYNVAAGATLTFSQAALKKIAATNLTVMGTVTIQSSTIELAAGGKFINRGTLNALGGITLLAAQGNSSGVWFENRGTFAYNGNANDQPFLFLAPVYFYNNLVINSGRVVIGGPFTTNSSVVFTAGNTLLEVQAGPPTQVANFANVVGGVMNIAGNARFHGTVSVTSVKLLDSGSVAFFEDVLINIFVAAGKITTAQRVRVTDFTLAGGNLNSVGDGIFSLGNLLIQDAASGNTNSFINAPVTVSGNATIAEEVVVLFGASGYLWIAAGANFYVNFESRFVQQVGSPYIRLDGTMFVTVDDGYLESSLNINGTGTLVINAGKLDFTNTQIALKTLNINTKGFVNFINSKLNIGSVTGNGGFNVSTLPGNNTLGNVVTGYLGFINGPVSVSSFIAEAVDIQSAQVVLNAASQNKAFEIYFKGGSIVGPKATISTNILEVGGGSTNEILDGVQITTKSFKLVTGDNGALLTKNGASIITVS